MNHYTGFQARWKRREVELDLQVSPEEFMNREVKLGCESWTSFAPGCFSTAVQQTLSLWLCPARQLKQQLCSALVAEQWRGDTALTLPLFLRRSRVSPVFWGQYPRSSLHSFVLSPPTPSPSLISNLASVDVKQHGQGLDEPNVTALNGSEFTQPWSKTDISSTEKCIFIGDIWPDLHWIYTGVKQTDQPQKSVFSLQTPDLICTEFTLE